MFVEIYVSDLILAEVLVDFELNGVWYDILLSIMELVDKVSHKVLCQHKYSQNMQLAGIHTRRAFHSCNHEPSYPNSSCNRAGGFFRVVPGSVSLSSSRFLFIGGGGVTIF